MSKLDWWEDKEVRGAAGVICIEFKTVKKKRAQRRRQTFVSELHQPALRAAL